MQQQILECNFNMGRSKNLLYVFFPCPTASHLRAPCGFDFLGLQEILGERLGIRGFILVPGDTVSRKSSHRVLVSQMPSVTLCILSSAIQTDGQIAEGPAKGLRTRVVQNNCLSGGSLNLPTFYTSYPRPKDPQIIYNLIKVSI
jgi:hypothetical protein